MRISCLVCLGGSYRGKGSFVLYDLVVDVSAVSLSLDSLHMGLECLKLYDKYQEIQYKQVKENLLRFVREKQMQPYVICPYILQQISASPSFFSACPKIIAWGWAMLVSILVIMAGVSLSDAEVNNPHRFVPQACGVGETAIETKLRSDHNAIVVQLDPTSLMTHQQVSVLHAIGCKFNASVGAVGNLLPDLHPVAFESGEWHLGQDFSFVFQLDISPRCKGQVGIADSCTVKFDLMEMAELVGHLEARIEEYFPGIGESFSLIALHPCRGATLDRSFAPLSAVVSSASVPINIAVVDVQGVEEDVTVEERIFGH